MNIEITPLVLTFNEQENVARALRTLSWAKEVVIVDSGSTDKTLEIARSMHPNVRILQRDFDTHAAQWNFGLDQVCTEWVLSLDADYVPTPELIAEIERLEPGSDVAGYSTEFRYCIFGRPLRASVYPPRTTLFRVNQNGYRDEGHTQVLESRGPVLTLSGKILHDDRKPMSRWLQSQWRYATIEARYLLSTPYDQLNSQDKLRRLTFFAPPGISMYLLLGRGLMFDGWQGWFYVAQRTIAELLLSIRLLVEIATTRPRDN